MNPAPRHGAPELHRLNYSQEAVLFQARLLPRKGTDNIVFCLDLQDGFDLTVMRQAVGLLFDRHDCLRLTFTRKLLSIRQFFAAQREPEPIPEVRFEDADAEAAYTRRFAKEPLDLTRGQTLRLVFVTRPDGMQSLLCKTSHFVADLYGIGVLMTDLLALYRALQDGSALPPAPGSYEDVVRKDNTYYTDRRNRTKDRKAFRDYITRQHTARPLYCGFDGDGSKRRSPFYVPFDMRHQATVNEAFGIPAGTLHRLEAYCRESGYSLSAVLYYVCALSGSLQNGRAPLLSAMEFVDGRATVRERKAAGTKVQSLINFIGIDYGKSLSDNLAAFRKDLDERYRYIHFSIVRSELELHRRWLYLPMGFIYSFCFSYLRLDFPPGVSFRMVHSDKSPIPCYIVLRHDLPADSLTLHLIVRKNLAGKPQLEAFRDRFVQVLGRVVAAPDLALDQIL